MAPPDLRPRFAELYEPLAPALCAWAELRCRGPLGAIVEAADLVQETCLQAYRSLESFSAERGEFRAWFFGVASRVASGALRRHARRSGLARVEELSEEPLAAATTISRRVRREEALQRFLAFAEALPEDERRLLSYRGLEGLEYEEIAPLLEATPAAVAKRWQRLRERLRELPIALALWPES